MANKQTMLEERPAKLTDEELRETHRLYAEGHTIAEAGKPMLVKFWGRPLSLGVYEFSLVEPRLAELRATAEKHAADVIPGTTLRASLPGPRRSNHIALKNSIRIREFAMREGTRGITSDEAEDVLDLTHQTCSAIITKSKKDGVLWPINERRKTTSGRFARVLVVREICIEHNIRRLSRHVPKGTTLQ